MDGWPKIIWESRKWDEAEFLRVEEPCEGMFTGQPTELIPEARTGLTWTVWEQWPGLSTYRSVAIFPDDVLRLAALGIDLHLEETTHAPDPVPRSAF